MAKLYGTPGPRALWPSVARSRNLASCSLGARLLFDRLISQADDQGRLEGDPILVRAACMPLDAEASLPMIRRWLNELEAAGKTASEPGLIVRYASDGQALIQLAKWWTYQSGQKRIYASRWPKPERWPDDRIKNVEDPRTGRHEPNAGDAPGDAPPDGAGDDVADGAGDAPGAGAAGAPEPVPARAGFRAEALTMPEPENVPSRSTKRGAPAVDDEGPLLTRAQLDAWSSFGSEWDAFKAAWLDRSLKLPPSGEPDEESSQRATLHPIVADWPNDVAGWVRGAPKGASGRDVVGHVIRCYRDAIAGADDETPDWMGGPSRAEATEALGAILGLGKP